jgi:uncharacterized membrane protein (UPF0127 family)
VKTLNIKNKTSNKVIGKQISVADNMVTRFFGLMGKKKLESQEGLFLTPCNSIHMMFMKFPIDVIFLDKNNKIVYTVENLKPWRVSPVIFKAQSALELPVGTITATESKIEDVLEIQ